MRKRRFGACSMNDGGLIKKRGAPPFEVREEGRMAFVFRVFRRPFFFLLRNAGVCSIYQIVLLPVTANKHKRGRGFFLLNHKKNMPRYSNAAMSENSVV